MRLERAALARLDALKEEIGPVECIYLGYYNDGMHQHCLAHFEPHRLVLLDDGTGTFGVAAKRKREFMRRADPVARLRNILRERLTGFKRAERRMPATFFTVFSLSSVAPDDVVVKHCFRSIQGLVNPQAQHRPLFVGQPLVDLGMVTTEGYLAIVAEFVRVVGPAGLYAPHPRESASVVDLVQRTGLEISQSALPLELRVAVGELRPSVIGGIFSSALVAVDLICGSSPAIPVLLFSPTRHEGGIDEWVAEVALQIPRATVARVDWPGP